MKYLAAVALLLATSAVSYWCGYSNNDTESYKAACLFSDAIRLEYDNVDDSLKNCIFTAYSSLEESCCEEELSVDSLLKQYVYSY